MEKLKLGDICKIVTGSTPKTSIAEYWDGNINWITPVELTEDTYIVNDSQRKITNRAIEETGLKSFPKGTVILTSRAPIGKVAIAGKEMYCNQGFKNLICSSKINNKYLYWYLKGHTEYLNSLGRGATFKEISKTIVENIEIPVPDLDTQKNCVDVLEKCNKIIKSYQKQLKSFDTLVKSRFIELFENKNNCKISNMNDICEGILAGGDRPKDTSEIRTKEYPYPVFANAATNEGLLCFSRNYKIDKPCVTIAARGCTVGFTAIRNERFTPVVRLISLIPKNEITPMYLKYFIDIKMCIEGNGAAQPQLTLPMIREMKISVPPLELQNKFAVFVAHVDKSKLAVQKSLDELETLKKSLMQEYFG